MKLFHSLNFYFKYDDCNSLNLCTYILFKKSELKSCISSLSYSFFKFNNILYDICI